MRRLVLAASLALPLAACAGGLGSVDTPTGRQQFLDNVSAAVNGADAAVSFASANGWITPDTAVTAHKAADGARSTLAHAQVALNSPECQEEKVDLACGMQLILAASQAAIDIRAMIQAPAEMAIQQPPA